MANWVKSVLVIYPDGSQEAVMSFRDLIDVLGGHLNFNSIVPMPSELEAQIVPFADGLSFVTEEINEWRYEHWGTKSGAIDIHLDVVHVKSVIGAKATRGLKITFETATLPAIPIVKALAARFPRLAFNYSYTDPEYPDDEWGKSTFKSGMLFEQNEHRLNDNDQ